MNTHTHIPPVPKVGDMVYVGTSGSLSHGCTDRQGGLAKVTRVYDDVSGGKLTPFVRLEPFPGTGFNWKFLAEQQAALKAQFGERSAFSDPDHDLQFNQP